MAGRSARLGAIVLGITAITASAMPAPSFAQTNSQDAEARLRKLEAEVRALQRQVFPGGDGRYFARQDGTVAPAPSVSTDTLTRLDSIEAQIARLTNQVEQNTNTLAQISARVGLAATPGTPTATPTSGIAPVAVPQSSAAPQAAAVPAAGAPTVQPAAAAPIVPAPKPTPAAAPAGPSPQRVAAVKAIPKPATSDAGDDEYSYGFRLWDAKFYPEAAQQLRKYVDGYAGHWRMSYAMNLLGRAYLDDGKPAEAAPWFLKNYQTNKQGDRAGDSLLYLSQAMIATGDKRRACIALAEFGETYPALASGRLSGEYSEARRKVSCN